MLFSLTPFSFAVVTSELFVQSRNFALNSRGRAVSDRSWRAQLLLACCAISHRQQKKFRCHVSRFFRRALEDCNIFVSD